jgi:hypothetical protein
MTQRLISSGSDHERPIGYSRAVIEIEDAARLRR